jgi:hypothetical protein
VEGRRRDHRGHGRWQFTHVPQVRGQAELSIQRNDVLLPPGFCQALIRNESLDELRQSAVPLGRARTIRSREGGPGVRGYGAGVNAWRRMTSAILTRSGGPPAAAFITSSISRKYSGPIAAGVITHSAFASWFPGLSKR